jgi:hypothetical protein
VSWEQRGGFVFQALLAVAQRSQAPVRAQLDSRRIPYQSFYSDNSIYIVWDTAGERPAQGSAGDVWDGRTVS